MKKMVKNIRSLGFSLTEDECLFEAKGEVIQRPHIATALLKKKENITIVEGLMKKLKVAAGKDEEEKERYKRVLAKITPDLPNPYFQVVFELFLTKDAFIKGIYVGKKGILPMDETVDLIRNAGGVTILAHWSESKKKFSLEMIEKMFQEKRLDGAEIVFNLYYLEMGREAELRTDQGLIKALVDKYGVLTSGGSDTHIKERLIQLAETKWLAKQTIGLTETILRNKKVFKDWSTV